MRAGQLYRQIAFDQEPLTLGVEDGLLDVLAGKGLDRFPEVSETHADELGRLAGVFW